MQGVGVMLDEAPTCAGPVGPRFRLCRREHDCAQCKVLVQHQPCGQDYEFIDFVADKAACSRVPLDVF